jgi:hypothetical protein
VNKKEILMSGSALFMFLAQGLEPQFYELPPEIYNDPDVRYFLETAHGHVINEEPYGDDEEITIALDSLLAAVSDLEYADVHGYDAGEKWYQMFVGHKISDNDLISGKLFGKLYYIGIAD